MTEETAPATEVVADAAPTTTRKSIVPAKYATKYKNRSEWMSNLLKANASLTKTIPGVEAKGTEGQEGYVAGKPERTVVEGVDTNALFKIGAENGLNLDKYHSQVSTHGFPGRFRMTVGNMLRPIAKQRHGIVINGAFVSAPAEWLSEVGAPAEPTHNQDGTKIAKAVEAAPEPESKLIKAENPEADASQPTAKGKKGKKGK